MTDDRLFEKKQLIPLDFLAWDVLVNINNY